MDPGPPPRSLLDRHRILSPSAAVRVSPLALGAMNFGDAWKGFLGDMTKETAFEMLDYFYSQGGNLIDTANNYQNEQSEIWTGEWLASHPDLRDQMVIATKFTTNYRAKTPSSKEFNRSAFGGNSAKSLRVSVDASLRKLQTSYIDILYVHWWDFTTSIPELMLSLNDMVKQGKVLYLGVSDTPAWIVSKANEYARGHGLHPFVVYQGRWSAADRDFERDILGMCAAEGMGLMPWGVLGGGKFKNEKQREATKNEGRNLGGPREKDLQVSAVLEEVANSKGTSITSVALAYVLHKAPYVFPIVGGRKVEHLKGNIEALGLELSDEDLKRIEGATEFDVGFPLNFLGGGPGGAKGPADVWATQNAGTFDYVEGTKPIPPQK
ncbi:hypothetical protein MMC07_003627, partial [Pseudocyphellaria aurata]|nr:hypothetical protein [Pseudocyphellaria aurata]